MASPAEVEAKQIRSPHDHRAAAIFISRISAWACMIVGVVVLLGWWLNISVAKSIVPGFISMMPNTALCFLLAGISLSFQIRNQSATSSKLSALAALIILCVGLLTILEFSLGAHWKLDRILLLFPVNAESVRSSYRMAGASAVNMTLLGVALFLLPVRRAFPFVHGMTLIAMTLAALSLSGYIYEVESLSPANIGFWSLALNTAIAFLILTVGILCAMPDYGIVGRLTSETLGGNQIRQLLPMTIAVLLAIGWIRLQGQRAGLFSVEFGVAVFTVATIAIFVLLILQNARSMDRLDASRRLAEGALRKSRQRLETLMINAPVAIYAKDANGRYLLFNSECEKMTGRSQFDVLGKTDFEIWPGGFASAAGQESSGKGKQEVLVYTTNDRKVIDSGEVCHFEESVTIADGTTHTFCSVKSPLFDDSGSVEAVIGISIDITDRKKAEAAMTEYLKETEELNGTLLQSKSALEEAVAELRRSNQELDEFAYVASHDLREPLRGIHNYATFLLEDYGEKLGDDGRQKLQTLSRLALRMDGLIESLLHFSRLGRTELAVGPTDLNMVLAEVIDSLHISLNEKGVEVRVPRPLPTITCDSARVGEIFRNLISNALKYNDKPEKWVEIGYEEADEGKESDAEGRGPILFYVRDNGIGIAEKHLDMVFRMFKRLHGRDQYGGGAGAGLAFVKRIVERHDGHVWFESECGKGSVCYFTLEKEKARRI